MKLILTSLLLVVVLFPDQVISQPIAASFFSNQPKKNLMKGIEMKRKDAEEEKFQQKETKLTEKTDENYIYYIFEMPSMFDAMNMDDFKIDVTEKLISIKGKVSL